MTLDDSQRKKVAQWIAEGMKLSEIQNRLASELGVRMTYMDVRFLVDDLKLTPKDTEPPKPVVPSMPATPASTSSVAAPGAKNETAAATPAGSVGNVSGACDPLARPA